MRFSYQPAPAVSIVRTDTCLFGEVETRELLRQGLQDPRSAVRVAVARGLWRLKSHAEEVLPVLAALLNHKLASTRAGALKGLCEMGCGARPCVSEVQRLTSDENESVRGAASEALKKISGQAQNRKVSTADWSWPAEQQVLDRLQQKRESETNSNRK